jgi:phosphoglycerate-specific signal transduction histidine kinase
MLFAHARQILLRNAEAAVLAREIAGFSTSETMTRIEALYHEEVREAEERERWIGLTLHLLGAAAALGLVLSVLRIREISQRLAKTNQELEREIEFRKMVEAALDAAKAAAEEASRDKSRFIADMA